MLDKQTHANNNPGGCWDWSCRICHAPIGVDPTGFQVGKKLCPPPPVSPERKPDFIPPYEGWSPYCLKCNTVKRMKATTFGWQCVACNNPIGRNLQHWNGTI